MGSYINFAKINQPRVCPTCGKHHQISLHEYLSYFTSSEQDYNGIKSRNKLTISRSAAIKGPAKNNTFPVKRPFLSLSDMLV